MASEPDQKLPSSQPLSLNQSSKKKPSIKDIIKFVIAFAVIVFILVWYWRSPTPAASPQSLMAFSRNIKEGVVELNQTVSKKYAWIKQKVDHFNPSDDRTFFQRILVNTENSNSKSISPVFLFLSHLEPVTSAQKSYLLSKYIEEKRGISLALEMRYFGESRPFYQSDAYSLANLKYLSLQQMVEDVAFAIQRIIDNRFFGISERNKWIINGYHVTGTIAAWVRAKYPTLSAGAIVSGPVLPTPTAPLINQRIYAKVESAGKKCRVIVDKIRQNIQEQLADDSRQAFMYGIGQGVQFTAQQILYFYEQRISFIPKRLFIYNCHPSTEAALITDLTKLILGHTIPYDPLSLSQKVMSSVQDWQYFEVVRSARAFWYLRCTQIGLFQTPPTPEKSFASPRVNQTFFRQRCKTIFGVDLWPNSQPLLDMYQPFLASATNLMIMHAYYNVYLPYALNGTNPRTQTIVKRCLQCQELFDYAQYFTMPDEIEDAFAQQRDALQKWLRK